MRPEGLLLDDTDLKYYFETAITTLVATHFNCNSYSIWYKTSSSSNKKQTLYQGLWFMTFRWRPLRTAFGEEEFVLRINENSLKMIPRFAHFLLG